MASKFTVELDLIGRDDSLDAQLEVELALSKIRRKVADGQFSVGHTESILDCNGNRIGSWKFHP